MKSYTDIEQSKKLAEILPLESADMCWIDRPQIVTDCPEVPVIPDIELKAMLPQNKLLPCWSLAALLNVLPNGIVMNKDSQNGRYHFSSKYIGTYVTADNPIDACYEMILKLHEQNIL